MSNKYLLILFIGGVLLFAVPGAWAETAEEKKENVIAAGKTVWMEYSLYIDDGEMIDSNVGQEPLKFISGAHQIIPGLDRQLIGLKEKDETTIEVLSVEAYGVYLPQQVREVAKDQLPKREFKRGDLISGVGPQGQLIQGKVTKVNEDTLSIDFNHPLAGKKLTFKIKVIKVEDVKTKQEDQVIK